VRLEDDVTNPPDYASAAPTATTQRIEEQTQDVADRAREAAGDMAENMRGAEARGREQASSGLDSVAEQLRERASSDGTKGEMAERAAVGMERTADYLREHSTGDMTADLEAYVREHPMQGVAAAVVAGFVIGRVLR
jgi:ElaB/YqjD/DUF883 family membrane-anchored ribosome-binding protein